MERLKGIYAALFVSFILVSTLLGRTAVHGGTTVFNFEWVFFFANLFLFAAAGYVLKMLLEGNFERGMRGTKRGNVLAGVITLLSLLVVIKLILENKPEELVNGGKVGETLSGVWYNVTSGDFAVTLRELPGIFYFIPFIVFILFLLTVRRRKKPKRVPFEVRFEPQMTYDSIEGTPAERVIKMYKNVVAGLVMKGYPYQKSWTHWEHEEKLREIFPDLEDIDILTRIFEKAKYAGRLDEADVAAARKSYDRLMELLR
ncbi:DUF4129 domain-containing protein [Thermococcus thioreducens]|uniref:Protein-glutamine gamma-glutamyltransferase-like C-terminal domain-containing protein n=1 Tax=Thermococcus thioreducens TaxID=277988 RepID=A0A0Q2QR19_9EURY|nr:DUF4129 domain-containing protein [Thermococcus thioreducens]ASJ12564.1 hypothetical protein A3L14_06540 [Thermococcus thioreducens]KQH82437.1 hypothetical protein AMR53_05700 [Thermococcus thioreducens]SEV88639.1 protein of unknown function [Thermococcus thioreducens]